MMIEIRKVVGDRKAHLPLLLLAGEQRDMVERYLDTGCMWVLEDGGRAVGECLVTDEGDGVVEVKSLAVDPASRGQGFGRALLDSVAVRYAGSFSCLQVCVDSGSPAVSFYERCGFVRQRVDEGFLADHDDRRSWRDGNRARDMVCLRRELRLGVCACMRDRNAPKE